MRFPLCIFLAASGLLAQSGPLDWVSLGFKAGSPLNDPNGYRDFRSNYKQSRWTGGPTVELHLPYRFSIEFDALYRSYDVNTIGSYRLDANVNPYLQQSSRHTRAWDMPLLLKYRFKVGSIRPFVSAGYLFTHEATEEGATYLCQGLPGSCISEYLPPNDGLGGSYTKRSKLRRGTTAAAGLEFRRGSVTISPEVRFSRLLGANPHENRLTALVGFTFGGKD